MYIIKHSGILMIDYVVRQMVLAMCLNLTEAMCECNYASNKGEEVKIVM